LENIFPYFGGKFFMLKDIYEEAAKICGPFSEHKIVSFVDVFGGSGNVLYNLPKSWNIKNKVYNDLDKNLFNTINALRDPVERAKIADEFKYVPLSRDLFLQIKNKEKNNEQLTPFEYLYNIANSFNSARLSFSVDLKGTGHDKYARIFEGAMHSWSEIRTWTVENLDFRELIPKYDSEYTYFYLDPPYLKGGKTYRLNFGEDDFKELHSILSNVKGYWLMNESEVDFEFIRSVFGEPKYIKEYMNNFTSRAKIANGTAKSIRPEGYWTNY
jgi:DNA adenine methylase